MLKIKDNDLDLYTKDELKKMIIELEENNKQKDNIIRALEYRLEKLNIKPVIEVYDYEHPTLGVVHCTRHRIPPIDYVEYQNFKK